MRCKKEFRNKEFRFAVVGVVVVVVVRVCCRGFVYSLFFVEPPLILPVRRAAIKPTFLPAGESRATVVA